MDPSLDELRSMKSVTDICDWVGLADGDASDSPCRYARSSFLSVLGNPLHVRQLVAIPLDAYRAAVHAWKVYVTHPGQDPERVNPTPVELGHPEVIRRVACLLLKLDPDDVASARQKLAKVAAGASSTQGLPVNGPSIGLQPQQKVLGSSVIDQSAVLDVLSFDAAHGEKPIVWEDEAMRSGASGQCVDLLTSVPQPIAAGCLTIPSKKRPPPCESSSAEVIALERHLMEQPKLAERACLQLRCSELGGRKGHVVLVLGDRCTLQGLIRVVTDCLKTDVQELSLCAFQEGTTGVHIGTHVQVTRPMPPAECDSIVIASKRSAALLGVHHFIRGYKIRLSQIFRGACNGGALEQTPADRAQRVVLSSPALTEDVQITLDGIMPDAVPEGCTRVRNFGLPLPRLVGSSFITARQAEDVNSDWQGSRLGPELLMPRNATDDEVENAFRWWQRRPLFGKSGADWSSGENEFKV